jgi:YbgC/YbaW family acyl-CoA thioester hydrolase
MPFHFPSRIRFVDTDASGRIHYSALFRHLEAAEMEFLRHLGIPYSAIETAEVSFPRVHVEAGYRAALCADDPISIAVTIDRIGNSSYTLAFRVLRGEVEAAHAKIVVASMNRSTGQSCALPSPVQEALNHAR